MPARAALWPSAGALRRVASCRAASSSAPSRPFTVYYADWARVDLPEGHRFPMDKYAYARAALDADAQLRGKILLRESPRVNMEDLLSRNDGASDAKHSRLMSLKRKYLCNSWLRS